MSSSSSELLTLFSEGAGSILADKDFGETVKAIFDSCKRTLGVASGYVTILSADNTKNELVFLDPGGLSCQVDPSLPMTIRGLRAEVYRTGKVVFDNDFAGSQWAAYMPPGHIRLDNVMFAPLVIKDQTMGLLGLANKQGGFTEDDAELAATFGRLAAIALLNKRTHEALKQEQEKFHSVAHSAQDAIISADNDGNVVFWNQSAQKIFGYLADEIIGRPLTTIIPEDFHVEYQQALKRYRQTGQSKLIGSTFETRGLRKGADVFPIEMSLASWATRDGIFSLELYVTLLNVSSGRRPCAKVRRNSACCLITLMTCCS